MAIETKNAIIIGASSGIGYALAENLVSSGYTIGITARRVDLLRSFSERYPGRVHYTAMDVTQVGALTPVLDEFKRLLGTLDLFVISAGTGDLNPELNFEVEQVMIETNVLGFTALADWAFNTLRNQGFGTLAAITSIAGLRGNGDSPGYSATKAYQVNYLEGLRHKAYKTAKRMNVIDLRPGFVDTKMAKSDRIFWVCSVNKAAKQMISGIHAGAPVVYISKRWRIVGWILKIIPGFLLKRL